MIRGFAEMVGWFIFVCSLANMADLIEFRLYLTAPNPSDKCPKEQSMPLKPAPASELDAKLQQIKRDARRLTKTQPLTHSQALEALSREQGFKTYAALRAALKAKSA